MTVSENVRQSAVAFSSWKKCLEHIKLAKIYCFVIISSAPSLELEKCVEDIEHLDKVKVAYTAVTLPTAGTEEPATPT